MTLNRPSASLFVASALALAYVLAFWADPIGHHVWSPLGPNMLNGDSESFFLSSHNLRYRTLGYPFFIEAVRVVFGTIEAVPKVQLVVLAAAAVFMGWAVDRAICRETSGGERSSEEGRGQWPAPVANKAWRLSSAWPVMLVVLVLFASAIPRFHAYVLSEALFVPLLCIAMGLSALFLARPTAWRIAALSVSMGLAAVARPSALFFMAAWPLVIWLAWDRWKGRRWRLFATSVVPMLAIVAAEDVGRQFVGNASSATQVDIMNRRLFAKAIMMTSEPVLPERIRQDVPLADFVSYSRARAAPLRELRQRAPDWRIRAIVLRQSEARIEFPGRAMGRRTLDLAETRNMSRDALLGELGRAMLLSRPEEWAANAFVHWRGLWFLYSINDAGLASRYASLVESVEGVEDRPMFDLVAPPAVQPEPAAVVLASRLGAAVSFLASMAIVVLCVAERCRRSPDERNADLMAGAVASVMVHAHMVGTAFLAHVHLRYAVATWPLQAVYCAFMAWWAARRLAGRRRGRRHGQMPHRQFGSPRRSEGAAPLGRRA